MSDPVVTESAHRGYLPAGLPAPQADALSQPYWDGLRRHRLLVQRCSHCNTWQWGPEWLCHRCHAFDPDWVEVSPHGVIETFARVWHPAHPALATHGPYLVVLVALPGADGIRMVGNLLGDPLRPVRIGAAVSGRFEDHADAAAPFTLLQWALAPAAQ